MLIHALKKSLAINKLHWMQAVKGTYSPLVYLCRLPFHFQLMIVGIIWILCEVQSILSLTCNVDMLITSVTVFTSKSLLDMCVSCIKEIEG